ncbi:hypothetical protein NZD89_15365 [Alicyclobacillus fastidiosus]|uniref:Uncharacterized protein n=1 Tax=Alicyclobacillus fastidiosus TaxID=392011 RepID=A0ABY6ZA94_9BACL|nr:hypothetical protein [Alicyclobacillus fastidiosus]WAH39781.1 hypothetical protein NZD89_15365 [Alicyclobacillus fastidiosus]GMA61030.1 hypothetical protein GCM10025859_14700 [Alicyclobacillus fastidiosus]
MKRTTKYVYTSFIALMFIGIGAKVVMEEHHKNLHKNQYERTKVVQNSLVVHRISDSNVSIHILGMRRFPYPYDSMLAISSDADHETLRKFNLIHEFVNTHQKTPFGYYGLGLPFADSFFMYNGSNINSPVDTGNTPITQEMSWYKGVSNQQFDAKEINHYIKCGWIDTLHSYGDFSRQNQWTTLFSRQLAVRAINTLKENDDYLTVWTDHGNQSNVDNFGLYGTNPFYNYQLGSAPKTPYYHTDLTIPYGVRFVWPDGNSDVFGHTSMIYPITLPDGRKVWGFYRYTSSGYTSNGNPKWDWSVGNLSQQLTPQNLESLEKSHDYSIIAQHLEAINTKLPLPQNAIDALWLLAGQYDKKKILVSTTSQLLNYNVSQQYLHYDVTYSSGLAYIHINSITDPVDGTYIPTLTDIRGVTFYTSDPSRTIIEIWDRPIPSSYVQHNPSDGVAPSVGIKWFTWNTTNYAES